MCGQVFFNQKKNIHLKLPKLDPWVMENPLPTRLGVFGLSLSLSFLSPSHPGHRRGGKERRVQQEGGPPKPRRGGRRRNKIQAVLKNSPTKTFQIEAGFNNILQPMPKHEYTTTPWEEDGMINKKWVHNKNVNLFRYQSVPQQMH